MSMNWSPMSRSFAQSKSTAELMTDVCCVLSTDLWRMLVVFSLRNYDGCFLCSFYEFMTDVCCVLSTKLWRMFVVLSLRNYDGCLLCSLYEHMTAVCCVLFTNL